MPRHIAIIGAGISGLASAWFLKKKYGSEVKISLFEKSQRIGGWIQTIEQNGFLFEQGPRGCRPRGSGQETLNLVEALGIQGELITGSPQARIRYLYENKKLNSLPSTLWSFLKSPLMPALLTDLFAKKGEGREESIRNFFSRRLGSAERADRYIDPMVAGIYTGDIGKLSMQSCFPLFAQWEQKYGSLSIGALFHKKSSSLSPLMMAMQKHALFSFRNGMETLVSALGSQLEADIYLRCAPHALEKHVEGIILHLPDQRTMEFDQVILTLPAPAIGELIGGIKPLLNQIPYASVIVVNLGYRENVLDKQGFGYLISSREKEAILGCVWDSCVFPQQNHSPEETRLTVMIKGEEQNKEKAIQIALQAVAEQLGIRREPASISVKYARQSIPQYELGYAILIQEIQNQVRAFSPHITLSGTLVSGVSVNACIAHSNILLKK